MVILMMILGILGGLVAAASLWLGGAGLWLAFLGYVAGAAMGGVMLTLWIIARATLAPAPAAVETTAQTVS